MSGKITSRTRLPLSLNGLRSFEAVARLGRVGLAARELNVTHGAVSRQVRLLEEALGVPLFRMPSGAGHDAMKLHEVMPQAMLFVRGQNAGISHNPLESTSNDDIDLGVHAFMQLLDKLATEPTSKTP